MFQIRLFVCNLCESALKKETSVSKKISLASQNVKVWVTKVTLAILLLYFSFFIYPSHYFIYLSHLLVSINFQIDGQMKPAGQSISNYGQRILTKFCARIDMNAGRRQYPRDTSFCIWRRRLMKQNKQYDDKYMHARRLVNDCYYVLSDFLFGVVTFSQANTSVT